MEFLDCSGLDCFLDNSHYIISVIATLYIAPFINIITVYKNVTPPYKPILRHEYSVRKVIGIMFLPYLLFFLSFFFLNSFPWLRFISEFICISWLICVLYKLCSDSIVLTFDLRDRLAKKIRKYFTGEHSLFERDSKKFSDIIESYIKSEKNSFKNLSKDFKYIDLKIFKVKKIKEEKFKEFLKNLPNTIRIERSYCVSYEVGILIFYSGKLPGTFKSNLKSCFETGDVSYINLDHEIKNSYKNIYSYFVDLSKSKRSNDLIREIDFLEKILNKKTFKNIVDFHFYSNLEKIFKNKETSFSPEVREAFIVFWTHLLLQVKKNYSLSKSKDFDSFHWVENLISLLYIALKNNFLEETDFSSNKGLRMLIENVIFYHPFDLNTDFSMDYLKFLRSYYIKSIKEEKEGGNCPNKPVIFLDLMKDVILSCEKYLKHYGHRIGSKHKIQKDHEINIFLLGLFLKKKQSLKKEIFKSINNDNLLNIILKVFEKKHEDSDLLIWNREWEGHEGEREGPIDGFLESFLTEHFKYLENLDFLKDQKLHSKLTHLFSEIKNNLKEDEDKVKILDALISGSKEEHHLKPYEAFHLDQNIRPSAYKGRIRGKVEDYLNPPAEVTLSLEPIFPFSAFEFLGFKSKDIFNQLEGIKTDQSDLNFFEKYKNDIEERLREALTKEKFLEGIDKQREFYKKLQDSDTGREKYEEAYLDKINQNITQGKVFYKLLIAQFSWDYISRQNWKEIAKKIPFRKVNTALANIVKENPRLYILKIANKFHRMWDSNLHVNSLKSETPKQVSAKEKMRRIFNWLNKECVTNDKDLGDAELIHIAINGQDYIDGTSKKYKVHCFTKDDPEAIKRRLVLCDWFYSDIEEKVGYSYDKDYQGLITVLCQNGKVIEDIKVSEWTFDEVCKKERFDQK